MVMKCKCLLKYLRIFGNRYLFTKAVTIAHLVTLDPPPLAALGTPPSPVKLEAPPPLVMRGPPPPTFSLLSLLPSRSGPLAVGV